MDNLRPFKPKKEKQEVDGITVESRREPTEQETLTEAQRDYANELQERLDGMAAETILAEPDSPDFSNLNLEKIRSFTSRGSSKILFENILFQQGNKISPEQQQILRLYISLIQHDRLGKEGGGLYPNDPKYSSESFNLEQQIREKEIKLCREALGDELAKLVDGIDKYVRDNWGSTSWQEEIATRRAEAMPVTDEATDLLDLSEIVYSMSMTEEGTGDLEAARIRRQIQEAREALPEAVKKWNFQTDNIFLKNALEVNHNQEISYQHDLAMATMKFLDDKVKSRLAEMKMGEQE
ncbi:MAG: hypothetical protein WCT29_02085 [Candidatus Paceibacterota bacterium]|jgi:hypothetical protein